MESMSLFEQMGMCRQTSTTQLQWLKSSTKSKSYRGSCPGTGDWTQDITVRKSPICCKQRRYRGISYRRHAQRRALREIPLPLRPEPRRVHLPGETGPPLEEHNPRRGSATLLREQNLQILSKADGMLWGKHAPKMIERHVWQNAQRHGLYENESGPAHLCESKRNHRTLLRGDQRKPWPALCPHTRN